MQEGFEGYNVGDQPYPVLIGATNTYTVTDSAAHSGSKSLSGAGGVAVAPAQPITAGGVQATVWLYFVPGSGATAELVFLPLYAHPVDSEDPDGYFGASYFDVAFGAAAPLLLPALTEEGAASLKVLGTAVQNPTIFNGGTATEGWYKFTAAFKMTPGDGSSVTSAEVQAWFASQDIQFSASISNGNTSVLSVPWTDWTAAAPNAGSYSYILPQQMGTFIGLSSGFADDLYIGDLDESGGGGGETSPPVTEPWDVVSTGPRVAFL